MGDYHNCYTGDEWDATLCPDPTTCAANCALDNDDQPGYESTYGAYVRACGSKKTLFGKNVVAEIFEARYSNCTFAICQ